MTDESAYGLWSLVAINSLVLSFSHLVSRSHGRPATGAPSALSPVSSSLFVEMYGFPLTIYLLSGWLVNRYPGVDLFSHDAGHLWNTLLGWKVNPHFDSLHILSKVVILCGFILIMLGFLLQWPTLVTLILFPILVTMYVRLARREEREVLSEFGDEYRRYANRTPAFLPRAGQTGVTSTQVHACPIEDKPT